MDYKDKTICVYDNGLFVNMAGKLAESFGKVYYYSPWKNAFPKSNARLVGQGFDMIERVNNFFDVVDLCDLFVFPDVYDGDLQLYLEKQGKRVWGSRKGEELELYRDEAKRHMAGLGIAIGEYQVITGIQNLRKYLKENNNQWIKVSITRGDFESFHSPWYSVVEPRIDELEYKLGAKKNIYQFIVEDGIENAVEIGYDGYCIDGQFPTKGICGIEIKDKGYLAYFKNYNEIPVEITEANGKIADTLKQYRYRNFISSEIRVTEETNYMLEWCTRNGSPPSELYMEMFSNIADIVWNGAEGVCIDPEPAGMFGAELLIHSKWAEKSWQEITFPEEFKNNISFRNVTKIDGKYYTVPQENEVAEIGAIVAVGDTIDEVVKKVCSIAEQIESYDLTIFPETFDDAFKELKKLETWGINLG